MIFWWRMQDLYLIMFLKLYIWFLEEKLKCFIWWDSPLKSDIPLHHISIFINIHIHNKYPVLKRLTFYTPHFNEVERGVYWFHLVRLSVCGQNRVRSVSSTILIGFISYLHILSSNFRRCVACNVCFKILKIRNFGKFFKFVTLTLSSLDLGSNMTQ